LRFVTIVKVSSLGLSDVGMSQGTAQLGLPNKQNQLVISLHGIRTRGTWQKEQLGKLLNEEGFVHLALDYGRFLAVQMLIPYFRRKKMDWFLSKYNEYCSDSQNAPSVIAHSFGTYIIAQVMEKHPEVRFDKMIFCGSIVRKQYSWTNRRNTG